MKAQPNYTTDRILKSFQLNDALPIISPNQYASFDELTNVVSINYKLPQTSFPNVSSIWKLSFRLSKLNVRQKRTFI